METKIRSLIKESMIEKNKSKQITYKNILEGAQKIAKINNEAVTYDMIIRAVKNEIKQLNDVIGYYDVGSEKYNEITEKIGYCEAVLPRIATEQEIMDFLVNNSIEKNIGSGMKALKSKFGANMDGKIASMVAKKYISE